MPSSLSATVPGAAAVVVVVVGAVVGRVKGLVEVTHAVGPQLVQRLVEVVAHLVGGKLLLFGDGGFVLAVQVLPLGDAAPRLRC